MESAGMKFVGQDVDGERMEIMELDDHPFYTACQYHLGKSLLAHALLNRDESDLKYLS